jgi:hypothetical protein
MRAIKILILHTIVQNQSWPGILGNSPNLATERTKFVSQISTLAIDFVL